MIGMADDFDHDLVNQQLEELSAEVELREFDYANGRISFEQFQLEHYSLVAKYRALRRH